MLRLLTKWRTLASDCVSLASRPGLSGLGKMVAQCTRTTSYPGSGYEVGTRIAYVVWRGLRLLTTWRKSFVSYASTRVSMSKICNRYLAKIDIWYNSNLWHSRELKQATFLSTRTSTGSKPRRYRWRMMASAVLVWNHERENWMTAVVDFKRERLTPSLAIYYGAIYFRLTSVLTKTSPA